MFEIRGKKHFLFYCSEELFAIRVVFLRFMLIGTVSGLSSQKNFFWEKSLSSNTFIAEQITTNICVEMKCKKA